MPLVFSAYRLQSLIGQPVEITKETFELAEVFSAYRLQSLIGRAAIANTIEVVPGYLSSAPIGFSR